MLWRDYRLKSENIQREEFNISEPIRITMAHMFVERIWIPDVYLTEGDFNTLRLAKPGVPPFSWLAKAEGFLATTTLRGLIFAGTNFRGTNFLGN